MTPANSGGGMSEETKEMWSMDGWEVTQTVTPWCRRARFEPWANHKCSGSDAMGCGCPCHPYRYIAEMDERVATARAEGRAQGLRELQPYWRHLDECKVTASERIGLMGAALPRCDCGLHDAINRLNSRAQAIQRRAEETGEE